MTQAKRSPVNPGRFTPEEIVYTDCIKCCNSTNAEVAEELHITKERCIVACTDYLRALVRLYKFVTED